MLDRRGSNHGPGRTEESTYSRSVCVFRVLTPRIGFTITVLNCHIIKTKKKVMLKPISLKKAKAKARNMRLEPRTDRTKSSALPPSQNNGDAKKKNPGGS